MAERRRIGIRALAFEAAMVIAALIFAFPLYVLVTLALKPQSEWIRDPLSLPSKLYLDNITLAWTQANLGTAMLSSVLVTVSSVVILVGLGSLAAYWIARRGGRLGYTAYVLFLAGMILPFQLALIPLYKLMRDLGVLGSPVSLILFYPALKLPLTIFLYAGYIRSLPRSYEEAAIIDGANQFQTFVLVVLPMLRPITGTVVILNAVFVWNDFLTPLLYLSGSEWATVPVAIYSFAGQESSDLGLLFGGLLAAMVPVLFAFVVFQKRMMQGFAGGLKG
jgi:raffinose/stachyose/melibiose transport system permease protein